MSETASPDLNPSDDRLWALIDRYLAGECTGAEADAIRVWLTSHPSHKELLESARRIREVAAARPPARSAAVEWRRAVTALGLDTPGGSETRPRSPNPAPAAKLRIPPSALRRAAWVAGGAAAAAALTIGSATLWRAEHRPPPVPPQAAFTTYTTQRGQRLSLRLRDGTRVVLAPASKLQKPTDYGVNTRTLLLEGEAYFDVAHDSVRPMVVRTERVVARDLGTRFVVRAYADASATEIVVAEGKVGVDTLVLERRQRAAVTADRKIHLTSGVALDRYFAWTEGRLVFRDTPLREVVSQLARWYDVDIRLAGRGLGDRRLTASFDEVPVTEVFDRIGGPLALEVVRDGRAYTVRAR